MAARVAQRGVIAYVFPLEEVLISTSPSSLNSGETNNRADLNIGAIFFS